MAEEEHDFLDDVISISKDWKTVKNPLGGVADALTADPDDLPQWDPSAYKERPRTNNARCVSCQAEDATVCRRCMEACPVDAISIQGGKLEISDACRKCGVCIATCPNEAFADRTHTPRRLYDQIAKVAGSHNHCYITCTRAIGHVPADSTVVLPCVGTIPDELMFALLCDFKNISIYLPYGICDRCRTTTGEEAYVGAIGAAEEWTGRSMGLEMEEDELDHSLKRSYERTEFVRNVLRTGAGAATAANPVLTGAQAIAQAIKNHTKQINALESQLDKVVGSATTQKKRRTLTQRRQLALVCIQKHPNLAKRVDFSVPSWNSTSCTACGDCVKVCPFNVIDLDAQGHMAIAAAYCTACGACIEVCAPHSLTWRKSTPDELAVPDENAARRKEREEQQKQEIEKLKDEGRARLTKALDALEHLADEHE